MNSKVKNFFNKINFFNKNINLKNNTKKIFKQKIRFFLVILVVIFWIFSIKNIDFNQIEDFSAKIILENFWEYKKNFYENKNVQENFLDLKNFLEKIKSWDEKKINKLQKIYWISFPKFWEILDEKVVQTWDKIKFYFEATIWKWDSIHEFFYEWKIVNWKVLEVMWKIK